MIIIRPYPFVFVNGREVEASVVAKTIEDCVEDGHRIPATVSLYDWRLGTDCDGGPPGGEVFLVGSYFGPFLRILSQKAMGGATANLYAPR